MGLTFHHRDDAPPGDMWSPPLILELSDKRYVYGKALLSKRGRVHSWLWEDGEGHSYHEDCFGPVRVRRWALRPSAAQIALEWPG